MSYIKCITEADITGAPQKGGGRYRPNNVGQQSGNSSRTTCRCNAERVVSFIPSYCYKTSYLEQFLRSSHCACAQTGLLLLLILNLLSPSFSVTMISRKSLTYFFVIANTLRVNRVLYKQTLRRYD